MMLCNVLKKIVGKTKENPWHGQIAKERLWRPGMPDYFENVFSAYRMPLDFSQYSLAIDKGLSLFERYRAASPDFDTQHKGSPFYALGYAAYASHDYSTASLMFDAAVAEDLRRWGPTADKPALLFMRLEDKGQDVLASKIVRDIIKDVEDLILNYNGRRGAVTITLAELRRHFLVPVIASPDEHKRTIVTAFISFVAEWKYRSRLISLVRQGSREPFFLHLFRGCLLFESVLKESLLNPRPLTVRETLGPALQRLHRELNVPNNLVISANFFDQDVLAHIAPNLTIEQAIQYTGKSRNTLGHTLVWDTPSLDKQTYDLLVEVIAIASLHAISTTYR